MYLYDCHVLTAHGSVRVYQLAALSVEAAAREAKSYGRVLNVFQGVGVQIK